MPRQLRRVPMQLLLSGAVTVTAALALGFAGCSTSGTTGSSECVSTEQFFAEKIWAQTMSTQCIQCHNPNGQAKDTPFVLRPPAEAGYLEANLALVKTLAQTQRNGESILLLKPTKQVAHDGGQLFKKGSQQYNDFKTFIDKASADETCPTNSAKFFGGVELMSPGETLRKAALVLAARLPTEVEVAAVEKGGFDALNPILDTLMNEQPFYSRVKESYNDQFQTDFYLRNNALDILPESCEAPGADSKKCDPSSYYRPGWFDGIAVPSDPGNNNGGTYTASQGDILKYGAKDAQDLHDKLMQSTEVAVAREPLDLIEYIVRNNRPFSEVLTADYTVVNPYSAPAFGVTDVTFNNPVDQFEFHTTTTAGSAPRAGVLTMPVWLSRHPTTATNRNRHRARMVFFDWLGTDILKTAERPIDPTKITDFNPTMNSPSCNVCHANLDPIAGLFQNYQHEQGNQATYVPEFKWYQDMRPPGFGKTALPAEQYVSSLPWLGKEITTDPRFAIAITYNAFRMITGQDPMLPPDASSATFKDDFEAYLGEYYTFSAVAKKFTDSKFNYKVLVKELVMSPYFRAKNTATDIDKAQLKKFGPVGTAHLLTPEQLDRKVANLLGMPWTTDANNNNNSFDPFLTDMNQYRLLYGGIDSENVTVRIKDPNGIMANVIERMSNEMGCKIVGSEFALDKSQRKFFTAVDASFEPQDVNHYDIAVSQQAIKQQIVALREKLLGEKVDANDPEVLRTYDVFVAAWSEGKTRMAAATDKVGEDIPGACMPGSNYITGEALKQDPNDQNKYGHDKAYTLRAWMAVMTYILSDYTFVYE